MAHWCYLSIVLLADFKIDLRVVADWADIGDFGADHDVTAVAALPYLLLVLDEDLLDLNVVKQSTVAYLVVFLNSGNATEHSGQIGEALDLGGTCKAFLHIRPLVVLAYIGNSQVLGNGADAFQLLKPQLGMLVLNRLQEDGGKLFKTLLLGLCSLR